MKPLLPAHRHFEHSNPKSTHLYFCTDQLFETLCPTGEVKVLDLLPVIASAEVILSHFTNIPLVHQNHSCWCYVKYLYWNPSSLVFLTMVNCYSCLFFFMKLWPYFIATINTKNLDHILPLEHYTEAVLMMSTLCRGGTEPISSCFTGVVLYNI